MRHAHVEILYNFMLDRYKALIYLNGVIVQEMFDTHLAELKVRAAARIKELDATTCSPLTQAVQWTSQPTVWNTKDTTVQLQAFETEKPVNGSK